MNPRRTSPWSRKLSWMERVVAESPPALENGIILASERSGESDPLTLVMITADASEESRIPIQTERESVVERETVEQPSVMETTEQSSVLETEVMIAADSSEESKTPDQKEGEHASGETAEQAFGTGNPGTAICLGNEAMIAADASEESKSPNQ
jgi:hypothetical protein